MPTYDYLCEECSYEFELFQGINDDPADTCPQCTGKVRRLISGGAGIIFKGSGFYVTDNKNTSTTASKSENIDKKTGNNTAKTTTSAKNEKTSDSSVKKAASS